MTFLLTHFWGWMCGALALGVLVGAWTWSRTVRSNCLPPWLVTAGVCFAIGLSLAVSMTLKGRAGLWLEIALLLSPAYLFGCLAGSAFRTLLSAPEPAREPALAVARPASPSGFQPGLPGIVQTAPARAAAAAGQTPSADSGQSAGSHALLAPPPQPGLVLSSHPGRRPRAATGAQRDPLSRIRGLSAQDIARLHKAGIQCFAQIAALAPQEIPWLDSYVGANGRIGRDGWIQQARFWAQAARNERAAATFAPGAAAQARGAHEGRAAGAMPASGADATAAAARATALAAMAVTHPLEPVPFAANLGDIDTRYPGKRPAGLPRPRGDAADDLLKIKGVGRANIQQLHALGIFHFDQIADWTKEELQWVAGYLAYPGRLDKEDWTGQARFYAQRRAINIANRAATERDRKA